MIVQGGLVVAAVAAIVYGAKRLANSSFWTGEDESEMLPEVQTQDLEKGERPASLETVDISQ